jgi:FAD/FMN-containing dehydrogenase
MTTHTTHGATTIDPIALAALRRRFDGELLTSEARGYDAARRLANSRHDRRPGVIARCASAQDVASAVVFAREYGLEIAVRSGGHSAPGHSVVEGGMMIDLAAMRGIEIDPARRIAHVQPGATNGELVLAAQEYGLATTTGTCATVGMGGSTLGGGIGWLMGRFGMTIDNVLAFELVTADGEILTASADEHPELFWALRGGGGNFGVVTKISYRLHQLGQVLGGMLLFRLEAAPLALRVYRELTSNAPDELLAHAVLATVPEFGPALIVQAVYSGEDLDQGERVLAPLRSFGPPPVDMIARRSYAEAYMMLTPPLPPAVAYSETAYTLRKPSDAALDEMVAVAMERPSPMTMVVVHQVHGAATRVAPDATAFALREPHYAISNIGMWLGGTGEAETTWTWRARARMLPYTSRGVYVNFLGDEGEDAVRESYRANYARLAAIKAHYDPSNAFRRNQNIKPEAGRGR